VIIDISGELFYKVVSIVKSRNIKIYEQLQKIKPYDVLATARATKTSKIKDSIKKAIQDTIQLNIKPTKYQVHKRTKIAYVTINKYYDDILKEVINARDEQ